MRATMQSTDRIVDTRCIAPDGTSSVVCMCRVWEGVSDNGVAFTAYIPIVQVKSDADNAEFERDLKEHKAPSLSTQRAIDMRYFID